MYYKNIQYNVNILLPNGTILTIDDSMLDCSGSVVRNGAQVTNHGTITIKNLNREHRNELFVTSVYVKQRPNIIVQLFVGRDGLGKYLMFEKDVFQASTVREGTDYLTTIECISGVSALSKTFNVNIKNMQLKDVIKNLSETMGIGIGTLDTNNTELFNVGQANKTGHEIIRDLKRQIPNVDFFVDDNKLHVCDKGKASTIKAWTVTGNQLKAVPQLTENLVRLKMHLDPRINIGDTVDVKSQIMQSLNAPYIVQSVSHTFEYSMFGRSTGTTTVDCLYIQ